MEIIITRDTSFDAPEGKHKAILKDVIMLENRKTKYGWMDQVRLLFEIQTANKFNLQYMAGKNYEFVLNKGSELRDDLLSWSGFDLTEEELKNQKVNLMSQI